MLSSVELLWVACMEQSALILWDTCDSIVIVDAVANTQGISSRSVVGPVSVISLEEDSPRHSH